MTPAEQRKGLLLAMVRAEPSPVRRDVERRARVWIAMATLVSLAIFLGVGGPNVAIRPHMLVAATSILWLSVAALATGLALHRGRAMLGLPRPWLLAGAIAAPALLAATWFTMPWPLVTLSVSHGYDIDVTCLVVTVAMALAPLGAFLALRVEGDPVRPGVTGAIAGAAAGAWSCLLIELHCEMTDPRHIILGHLLPVVLLAIVGSLAARSILAIRAPSRSA